MGTDWKGDFVWVLADYNQAESRVCAWRGPIRTLKQWYIEKKDTHLESARLIAKFVQEKRIQMPPRPGRAPLFSGTPWLELTKKDDDERQIGKQSNHANNYGLGPVKFAQISGLPVKYAELIQGIHHANHPDIRSGYQKWIIDCLQRDRTIHLPPPFDWKRTFYDVYGPELERAAFAMYAQSTIGALLVNTLNEVAEVFVKDLPEAMLSVWSPWNIRQWGIDVGLQVHDNIGVRVPNDWDSIQYTCRTIKRLGEIPLLIGDEDPCVIPMDFKVGENIGDAKDYKDF